MVDLDQAIIIASTDLVASRGWCRKHFQLRSTNDRRRKWCNDISITNVCIYIERKIALMIAS